VVGRVTALGTVFSVKQDFASWEVFVTQGRVKVDEAFSLTPFSKVKTFSDELVAGQKVVQELDDSAFAPKVVSYS